LKRSLFLFTLVLIAALRAPAAEQHGQLDASQTLFSVLAAINAGGYDTDLASAANHPLRAMIRKELASRNLSVVPELKYFVAKHKKKDPAADLGQYISFALAVKGPPDFEYKFRKVDLPPDVEGLEGFSELMVRFHREANIDELWQQAQPFFDKAIERYHEPVSQAVLEVNGYLRSVTSGAIGRRFQIFIDLLGAPNQIQVRGYADDYYIIITPSPEPQIDDIRSAYLGYLIEPSAIKYSDLIMKNQGVKDYAQTAPALPEVYKSDFLLLTTRSLIKAIESRMSRGGKRQEMVDRALLEGFVLTPFFAEQLAVYEKQQESMKMYFPEMIKAIDLKHEEQRLEKVKFASEASVRVAKTVAAPPPPQISATEKALETAENLYRDRELGKAKQSYNALLQAPDEKSAHAAAYYGLARIAILERDPELAERLFQKALESSPQPQVRAWVEVYLARLSDAAGERAEAVNHYKQALAVEGGSAAAREAAEKGIQQSFQKK